MIRCVTLLENPEKIGVSDGILLPFAIFGLLQLGWLGGLMAKKNLNKLT